MCALHALDNAADESFFATLKRELVHRHRFPTRAAARTAVFEFIEVFYNRRRLHSSIGYRSPMEFERATQIDRERGYRWLTGTRPSERVKTTTYPARRCPLAG